MTIEIRQLVIRAVVDPRQRPAAGPDAPAPDAPPPAAPLAPHERDALVAACAREVMRALKKARER